MILNRQNLISSQANYWPYYCKQEMQGLNLPQLIPYKQNQSTITLHS